MHIRYVGENHTISVVKLNMKSEGQMPPILVEEKEIKEPKTENGKRKKAKERKKIREQ